MKESFKFFGLAIAFCQLMVIPITVSAQNSHECFMLDANGNPMDLRHLCGNQNNANTSTVKLKNPQTAKYSADFFVIPIKRRDGGEFGTPIIEVKFNDRYVFEMLFDTGATMTVITESMADALSVKSTGVLPFKTASNNLILFETASVSSVMIGEVITNDFNIAISPTLNMGLLGQDFYGMYDITIKYGTIEFRKR